MWVRVDTAQHMAVLTVLLATRRGISRSTCRSLSVLSSRTFSPSRAGSSAGLCPAPPTRTFLTSTLCGIAGQGRVACVA